MGLWNRLFGYAKPDGLIGCYRCGARTNGVQKPNQWDARCVCALCEAPFLRVVQCCFCGWKKGVNNANFYLYKCDGCGKEIASLGWNLLERKWMP